MSDLRRDLPAAGVDDAVEALLDGVGGEESSVRPVLGQAPQGPQGGGGGEVGEERPAGLLGLGVVKDLLQERPVHKHIKRHCLTMFSLYKI